MHNGFSSAVKLYSVQQRRSNLSEIPGRLGEAFYFSLFRVCGISPTQKPTIHATQFPHTHIKTHFPPLSDTMPRFISTQVAMATRATERIQWLLTSPSDTTHTLTPLNAHKTSADNQKPAGNTIHKKDFNIQYNIYGIYQQTTRDDEHLPSLIVI